MNTTAKKIIRKTGKVLAWMVAIIIFLVVLLYILIQVPAVQNFAKNKVVAYLEKKIHTRVNVGKLSITFPKRIVLENVFFEDQRKDTLLSAEKLQVDIALFQLIKSNVEIKYLELDGVNGNIYRLGSDTFFNFQYIVDAFAGKEKDAKTSTDTSKPMKFSVENIVLNRIHATFKDDQTGNDADFFLGNFETSFKHFDPFKYNFDLPKIAISGVRATVKQYKPLLTPQPAAVVEAESNQPINMNLKLGMVSLKDIKFDYDNRISALSANLDLGELSSEVQNIDLQKLIIHLKKTDLNNTSVRVLMDKSEQSKVVATEVVKETSAQANNPWRFEFEKLLLSNDDLKFDNNNNPRQPKGMDFSHLDIKGLTIDGNQLQFTPTTFTGDIQQLAFREQSGFNLEKLETNFLYGEKEAYLRDFVFKTDRSILQNKIAIRYPSIEAMAKNPGEIFVDASIVQSAIAVKDILTFVPTFSQMAPFKGNEYAVYKINGSVRGYLKDLSIPSMQLSGIGKSSISFSGRIKGLPDPNRTTFDIAISSLRTTRADLMQFIPKGTMPENIRVPETISLQGKFSGTMKNINTNLHLITNKGNIDLAGNINMANKSYNINAALKNVEAGYLLKQDTMLGRITMNITAKGAGFNPKTANALINGRIQSAYVKGYNYTNLNVKAGITKGLLSATANMKDRNISFALTTKADLSKKYPSVKLDLQLDTLNLQALKFMTQDYSLKGNISADFPVANPDSLVGSLQINNLVFIDSGKAYQADSIYLLASANGIERGLEFTSEAVQLKLAGKYKLTEIATGLQRTINRYYTIAGFKDTVISPQDWSLYARILPSDLLYQFAPQLKGSDSIRMDLAFNSEQNNLALSARAPLIVFGTQKIDSLTLAAKTNENSLDYALSMNGAGSKDFYINKTTVTGGVANNKLSTDIDLHDIAGKSRYQLGAILNQVKDGVRLSLKPDLLLNYDKWLVGNNNFIQYDSTGVLVNNFVISKDEQSLSINSTSPTAKSPIEVKFNNFSISTLTSFAGQKDLLANGLVNGNVMLSNVTVSPVFTSDLSIRDLSYKGDTLGNLAVQVNNQTANAYDANVKLDGNGNDVQISGKYYTGESRMDLKLDVNNLNLASIKKFSAGQLADASGSLKGSITARGTLKTPSVNGDLRFEKAYITPALLGEKFFLSNESIVVSTRDIIFDRFTIADSSGNKAIIDGNIYTNNFDNFRFDMDINAENFRAVNSVPQRNKLFYGKLNIDADVKIRGTVTAPTVTGDLKVNRATDFTMILPSEDPEIQSREGVVRFVDYSKINRDSVYNAIDTLIAQSDLKGIDLVANIQTDSAAQFTMVIDERNGDALKIKGTADLAATMDRSGKLSLTGSYEVQGGSYQLTFSLLQRKFDIQKGSIITWTGDPKSANVNITAVYLAKTAPIDLVQSQISGQNETDINRYKQKLPFKVYLKMNGELLKPIITFDIALQEDKVSQWEDVNAKLEQIRRDDAEMNKQVFALLLLNRFVAENPFQSNGGNTTAESLIRQSASRLLTEQLNQLAGNLIQGVDLNFGVASEDDYSTGTKQSRTDLNVGVSKRLLNDRLRVSVGSNFELEGPKNAKQSTSNIAGDVAVDYQLTKDGRYLLRAYRRNRYEGVIEGQVVETGVSFIFTLNYDEFKELFHKTSAAEKKRRKQERKGDRKKENEDKKLDKQQTIIKP